VSLASQALLIDAFINALAQLRAALTRVLIELFTAPKSWRDGDADLFAERAVPLVLGAQRAAASLTDDYLSRMIADQTGEPYRSRPVDLDRVTGAAVRNGVDPEVVYRRPHQEMWTALAEQEKRTEAFEEAVKPIRKPGESVFDVLDRIDAEKAAAKAARPSKGGALDALDRIDAERAARPERRPTIELPDMPRPVEKPLTEAVARGERRAKLIGLTDLELAVTHTVRERLAEEPRVKYFRRVLTGAENCGLCVVASTQRYHKADLLPIHPACDCVIAPILGNQDPGHRINTMQVAEGASATGESRSGVPVFSDDGIVDLGDLLEPVHDAIRDTFGRSARDAREIDYRKVLTVHEHGELGPVLSVKRHRFTKRQIRDNDLASRVREGGK
jgi:hypothetical protein